MEKDTLQLILDQYTQYSRIEGLASNVVAVAEGSTLESLESYQIQPNRINHVARLNSCDSFCQYVNRFKEPSTSIYLNVNEGVFMAVLDHYDAGEPDWAHHQAVFKPKRSIEWQNWMGILDRKLTQIELAEFIERVLDDIQEPMPNEMLQAALQFEANESMVLASDTNLDNGATRFVFSKDNKTAAVEFPHRIRIAIPLHEAEAAYDIEARIRYKTSNEGGLSFTISFAQDPRRIEREALLDLSKQITKYCDDLHLYEGTF